MVRISENGDIVWSKIYDDSRILATKQLFYISSDNSIIALTEHSFGDFLTDNEYKIHKFSEDGNKIWTKSIVIAKEPFSSSSLLKVIDGEEVFLSYSSKDERENIHDITLIKLDLEANIIWKKIFKGASTDLPEDILRSDDENLILLSSTYSCGNGEVDIMLTKINPSNQEIIWDKVYGSPSADFGNKILVRPNGNIIILGDTNHQNPSEAIFDFLILETDPEGNPI